MTNITINTALGGHAAGTTIDVTAGTAELLVTNGYAEAVEEPKAKGKAKPKTTPVNGIDNEGGGTSPTHPAPTAG